MQLIHPRPRKRTTRYLWRLLIMQLSLLLARSSHRLLSLKTKKTMHINHLIKPQKEKKNRNRSGLSNFGHEAALQWYPCYYACCTWRNRHFEDNVRTGWWTRLVCVFDILQYLSIWYANCIYCRVRYIEFRSLRILLRREVLESLFKLHSIMFIIYIILLVLNTLYLINLFWYV